MEFPQAKKQRTGSTISSKDDEQSKILNPSSLKDICIDFVALNIHLVDSLVGFPDIVGVEIFQAVQHHGHLNDHGSPLASLALQLFEDSYGELVLEDLNLAVFPRALLEDCTSAITTFCSLSQLDLSDQQLGDSHDLWGWLANLNNLTCLSLKNNFLTDRGLQHITMPMRMYKKGPIDIQLLNLSCNPQLTDNCIRYLTCFTKLGDLDLSGTAVTNVGIAKMEKKTSMRRQPSDRKEYQMKGSLCTHKGWAADTISKWIDHYNQPPSDQDAKPTPAPDKLELKPKSFYDKKKSMCKTAALFKKEYPVIPCPPPSPVIVFHKSTSISKSTDEQFTMESISDIIGNTSEVLPVSELSGKCCGRSSPTRNKNTKSAENSIKRQKLSDVTAKHTTSHKSGDADGDDNDDVMNMLANYVTVPSRTEAEKGTSLWSAMNSW